MRFPALTIGRRLLLLGATGVAAAVIICGVAFVANDRTESTYSEVEAFGQARVLVREIEALSQELNIDAYRALLKVSGPDASAEVNDDATEITDRLDALLALPLTDEDKGRFEALRNAFDEYLAAIQSVMTAATGPAPNAKTQDDRILTANDNIGVVMADTSDDIDRDIAELQESLGSVQRQARMWMLAVVVMSALTVIALTLALSRSTVRRMQAVAAGLDRLADGDLTRRLSDKGGDEVGGMSRAVDQVAERFTEIFRSLSATGGRLTSASSSLLQVADRVGSSSAEASSQAEVVAHSANAVTANVHAVAAGSEQMRSSIGEIARNANEAAQVALGAVQAVESTTGTMSKLGDSSREIGDVIRLITSIAEQTNLLALNATIEAARAGDAGKGFAVVADEVKQLAQETARATEDISRRVEAIQEDAESASRAIGEIASVIARINEFQSTIAAAVEEQTSSTDTISAGVSTAASGSDDIARSIAGIASAAGETATSMIEARANAAELSSMSDDLARIVAGFHL